MDVFEVRRWKGKKVKIFLKDNSSKFTVTIPEDVNETITVQDKFYNVITIECSMIGMIIGIGEGED
jgi:hypothetical protein